jgi:putative copper export protein
MSSTLARGGNVAFVDCPALHEKGACMDGTFRVVHVFLGVFWAGTAIFLDFFLCPTLKKLGPAVEKPTVMALMKLLAPFMTVASLLVLVTGITMVVRTRLSVDQFFDGAWGWAMFVAFVATVISISIGLSVLAPNAARLEKVASGIKGGPPTAAQAAMIERFAHRIETGERIETLFIIAALLLMPMARFL